MHPLRKHIEEVIALTDDEFSHVLSHFTPQKKRKNQYLIQEDELVNKEYWVIKGCLRSYFLDESGKEHTVQFAVENWWVTDYQAFEKQVKSQVYIDCLEDCELLYITHEDREKLSQEFHKMERFWAKKTKLGYIASQNRVLSLLKNTARERYELMSAQYPNIIQRVSKKMIASYLGVSRETLSRLYS